MNESVANAPQSQQLFSIEDPQEMVDHARKLHLELLTESEFQILARNGFLLVPAADEEDDRLSFFNPSAHLEISVLPKEIFYLVRYREKGSSSHTPYNSLAAAISASQMSETQEDYKVSDLSGNTCLCFEGRVLTNDDIRSLPLSRTQLLELLIRIQDKAQEELLDTFCGE
ncbi:MAG: hypothetical protein PHU71_02485 [Candidatus Gracilibacteria bacterium]|nr:hypothetical protein [Candidatus Gracilibacteria bacterium]